jgi:hypothetical protein
MYMIKKCLDADKKCQHQRLSILPIIGKLVWPLSNYEFRNLLRVLSENEKKTIQQLKLYYKKCFC